MCLNKQTCLLLSSCQVLSDLLHPHGLQHARFPCPWLSPEVCSNSCPMSQWCYLTISSSATLFSFCPQSFSASGSFPRSQLFESGGPSIGSSASAPVFPKNKYWMDRGAWHATVLGVAKSQTWLSMRAHTHTHTHTHTHFLENRLLHV